jgi:hypothetical protein
MSEILGQRCCTVCNEPHDTLGSVDHKGLAMGGTVTVSLALRDVVGTEGEFLVLSCGHTLHKLSPMIWATEHMIDQKKWDALPLSQKFLCDDLPKVTRDSGAAA